MTLPTTLARRYRILRELGRGGMGVVYQVEQATTGEQYAVKVIAATASTKGDALARFKREIKLPSRIDSEHVVRVVDSDVAEELQGAPFYVMELLRGCDLRRLQEAGYAFTRQDILWIWSQLTDCLEKAHRIGIIHRDLKPDNIFIHIQPNGDLIVKILDFGIARINQELLESSERGQLTGTRAMLGTPLYMSPEQAKGGDGRHLIGPSTDVWAIGLLTFELLSGRSYWQAESLVAHLGQLMFAPMPPPSTRAPSLSPSFDAWFGRSCAREVSERFPSVREQFDALRAVFGPGERLALSAALRNAVARNVSSAAHPAVAATQGLARAQDATELMPTHLPEEETRPVPRTLTPEALDASLGDSVLDAPNPAVSSSDGTARPTLVPLPLKSADVTWHKALLWLGASTLVAIGIWALVMAWTQPRRKDSSALPDLGMPTGTMVATDPAPQLTASPDMAAPSPRAAAKKLGRKGGESPPPSPLPASPPARDRSGKKFYVPPSL